MESTSAELYNKFMTRKRSLMNKYSEREDKNATNRLIQTEPQTRKKLELWRKYEELRTTRIVRESKKKFNVESYKISLSNELLRKIEAEHGSGMLYLMKVFLNSFYLNFFFTIIITTFVILPFFVLRFFQKEPDSNMTTLPCFDKSNSNITDDSVDIKKIAFGITGLFYGTYRLQSNTGAYYLKFSYVFVFVFCLLLTLVYLVLRTGSINSRRLAAEHSNLISYSIFSGYDYSCNKKVFADLNFKKIKTRLVTYLANFRSEEKIRNIPKMKLFLFRAMVTLYSFIYYSITISSIHFSFMYIDDLPKTNESMYSIMSVIPACLLVVLRHIFQLTNNYLMRFECYTAAVELFVCVLRLLVLYGVGLFLLTYEYLRPNGRKALCWESDIGLSLTIYLIIDIFADLVDYSLAVFVVHLQGKIFKEKREFMIASTLLSIFVCQVVTIICLFFSPWTPLIFAIKMLVNILILPIMLRKYYTITPHKYNNYLLKFLLDLCLWILFLFGNVLLGMVLTLVPVSSCGLFGISKCDQVDFLISGISAVLIAPLERHSKIIAYCGSSSFVFLIFCVLLLIASYSINVAKYFKALYHSSEKGFKFLAEENKELHSLLLKNGISSDSILSVIAEDI